MPSDDSITKTGSSKFRFATNRRFEINLKNEIENLAVVSATEYACWKDATHVKPLDEAHFTSQNLAEELKCGKFIGKRKSHAIFHDKPPQPQPMPPKEKSAIAADVLATYNIEPRSYRHGYVRPMNVLLQGAAVEPPTEPIESVREDETEHIYCSENSQSQNEESSDDDPALSSHPRQQGKLAIIHSTGTAQSVSYGDRKKPKKYKVSLIKKKKDRSEKGTVSYAGPESLDGVRDRKKSSDIETAVGAAAQLSSKVPMMRKLVEEAQQLASLDSLPTTEKKKRFKKSVRAMRRGTIHSMTSSVKPQRTVDDIVAELRHQFKSGMMTEADIRIQQLVNEVMSRTGGETASDDEKDTEVKDATLDTDDVTAVDTDDTPVVDTADTVEQTADYLEIELPMIPPPLLHEDIPPPDEPQPSDEERLNYYNIKKAWEDYMMPSECTAEELLGVHGNAIPLHQPEVSFLASWVPADDTSRMDDDIIEVTKKHKPKPIHHFCCTNLDVTLPSSVMNVGWLYHTPSRNVSKSQHTRMPTHCDTRLTQTDQPIARVRSCSPVTDIRVAEMVERVYDASDLDQWKVQAEECVMEDTFKVSGTKMRITEDSSRLMWTMAPDKFSMPPARVKAALFPQYKAHDQPLPEENMENDTESDADVTTVLETEPSVEERRKLCTRHRSRSLMDLTNMREETLGSLTKMLYTESDVLTGSPSTQLRETHPYEESQQCAKYSVLRRVMSVPSSLNWDANDGFSLSQNFTDAMKEVRTQRNCLRDLIMKKRLDPVSSPVSTSVKIEEPDISQNEVVYELPVHVSAIETVTKQPSLLPKLEVTPAEKALEGGRKYITRPPKNLKPPTYRSLPDLLDFDSYAQKRNIRKDEREFVRDIWNTWFDEVYKPTPTHSDVESDYSYNPEEDSLCEGERGQNEEEEDDASLVKENKSTFSAPLELPDDISYLLKTDENSFTHRKIHEEIAKVTAEIGKKPTAFLFARRGALSRKVGHLKSALEDLNKAIIMEPMLLDAYWHRHLLYLTEGRLNAALDDCSFIVTHNKTHYMAYLARAEIYRRLEDTMMSLVNYTQALRIYPHNHDAYIRRAQIYEKRGTENDMLLALEDYTQARQLQPHDTNAIMKHAQYYFNTRNWAAAIQHFTDLLKVEPLNIPAYIFRGRAYSELEKWELALKDFSSVIHLEPTHWKALYHRGCLLRKSLPMDALKDFSVSLLLNSGSDNIMSLFHRGVTYSETGRHTYAVTDFETVLKLDPNIASAHINLGIIFLVHFSSAHRAIKKFTMALKVNPTSVEAYALRAEAHRQVHELKNALRDYTRAIHLEPTMHSLHMYRGQVILEMGNLELAATCVRNAAALNKDMGMGEEATEQAIVYNFLREYDKAIQVLLHATYHKPSPDTYMLLGQTYMKAEKYGDAISAYKNALNLYDPNSPWRPWPQEAAEAYYMVGVCHEELKNFSHAHDELNNAIRLDPTHAMAYYHRGLCRMKLRLGRGILDFNRALSLNPKLFEVFLSRACYYGNKGFYCKAILNCNKALELQPQSGRAFLYRGALKYHIRAYELAIADLTMAATIDNGCALAFFNRANCYQMSGMVKEAIKDYGIVLLLSKDLKLKVFINRGLLYYNHADFSNALKDFQKAAKLNPKDLGIEHTIALCYHRLGELKMSVRVFSTTVQTCPTHIESYIGRGNVYMDWGHKAGTQQAKRDFATAVHLNPMNHDARVNLALCLQTLGKFQQAWIQFTTVLALDRNFQAALEGRAIISLQMSDTFSAYNDISASIQICPSAELYTNRGVISQFSKRLLDAMNDYKEAIELDPTYSLAFYNAANIYFYVRRFKEALVYYDKAIMYNDRDEGAYLNRAITKVMLQDSEGALEDFDAAIRLSPTAAHVYFNRANLYMSLLQYHEAKADYTKALEYTPDDPLILTKRAEVSAKLGQSQSAIDDYKRVINFTDK